MTVVDLVTHSEIEAGDHPDDYLRLNQERYDAELPALKRLVEASPRA